MVLENVQSHRSVYDELSERGIAHITSRNIHPSSSSSDQHNEKGDYNLNVKEMDNFETTVTEEDPTLSDRFHKIYPILRPFVHLFFACFFTAWWISILCQEKHRPHWLIPTVIYVFIMMRIVFWHVPSSVVVTYAKKIWDPVVSLVYKIIPEKLRIPSAFALLVAAHLLATFIDSPQEGSARLDRFISFLGYWLCIGLFYITSNNRKKIDWKAVYCGLLANFSLGLFILRTGAGHNLFIFLAKLSQKFLSFAKVGAEFLFSEELAYHSGYFVFSVFPATMFFASTVYILSYIGWVQWLVRKVSTIFTWGMNLSGMEAIVASAAPFIGAGEASILMKPYLPFATRSELHSMSAFAFSTISGGAIVGYAGLGLNVSALLTAAIMSIPLAIALSRLRFPETEEQVTKGGIKIDDDKEHDPERLYNVVHAFSLGSWTGIMICLAMATNLLCINATISFLDLILSWFGGYWKIHHLTLEQIVGYIFYPLTFFLGVSRPDIYKISKLLGIKLMYNEYNAYEALLATTGVSKRSQMLATYVLCSYANFGTLSERIAIVLRLAPNRAKDVTGVIWSALITGFMATYLTAAFAGCITVDVAKFSVTSAGAT